MLGWEDVGLFFGDGDVVAVGFEEGVLACGIEV
jgi:hypothetical protein